MSVDRSSSHEILAGTEHTLSVQFGYQDEAKDPGTVTVTVTNEDGDVIVNAATAAGTGTAPRTTTLTPAQTTELNELTAVWTSDGSGDAEITADTTVTTYARTVGDLLYTLIEARAFDGGALTAANYSDADMTEFRTLISNEFAVRLGYPAGRRYTRRVYDGYGAQDLLLGERYLSSVRSIEYRNRGEQTWTAYTAAQLADVVVEPWGRITRETLGVFTAGLQNIRVGFEHGLTSQDKRWPEISRAAKLVLRDLIVKSNVDDRATSFTDEYGSRTFVVQAGVRGAIYSLPEVNAIFQQNDLRVPGIG